MTFWMITELVHDLPREGMPPRGTLTCLSDGTHRNLVRFNKARCKVLHLSKGNSRHEYRQGDELIGSSSEKKDLRVPVVERLNTSKPGALTAQKATRTAAPTAVWPAGQGR